MQALQSWQVWALASAMFAALTAILAKVGVDRIDASIATFIRTVVILAISGMFAAVAAQHQNFALVPSRTYLFLALSGAATGLSWLCYFQALKVGPVAQVASLDKLSVVFVAIFATLFLGDNLTIRHWVGVGLVASGALLLSSRA